jgi:hypothetical protein
VCMAPPEEKNGLTNNQAPECPGLIRKWFGSSIRKHVFAPSRRVLDHFSSSERKSS